MTNALIVKPPVLCADCGNADGESETLDDYAEVAVQVRVRVKALNRLLCVTCYLDWLTKRGKVPQFGNID